MARRSGLLPFRQRAPLIRRPIPAPERSGASEADNLKRIIDMTRDLAARARENGLSPLAYRLDCARTEAELILAAAEGHKGL